MAKGIFLNTKDLNGYLNDVEDMAKMLARDIALLTGRDVEEVLEEYGNLVAYKKNIFRSIVLQEEGKEEREEISKVVGQLWKEGKLTEEQKKMFE